MWLLTSPCPYLTHLLLAGCFSEAGDGWLWGFGTSNQLGKGDDDEGEQQWGPSVRVHCAARGGHPRAGRCCCAPHDKAALYSAKGGQPLAPVVRADEIVPKKLADTKKFAGQRIVQLEFGGQHATLLCVPK